MTTIRRILKKELADLVESQAYAKWRYIPISRIRAQSHACNPDALPDDTSLILIEDGDQLAGYQGQLPQTIEGLEGRTCWSSCLWVNPDYRGQGIAAKLFGSTLEEYDHLLLTEFVPRLQSLFTRIGLEEAHRWTGLRAFMRFNLHVVLPPKRSAFRVIKPLLVVADTVLNVFVNWRLVLTKRSNIEAKPIDTIGEELWNRFAIHRSDRMALRSREALNWLLANPWAQQGKANAESRKYHFTSVSKQYRIQAFVLKDQDDQVALAILSIRNGHVSVPYLFCQPGYHPLVAAFVVDKMIEWRAAMTTVYDRKLQSALRSLRAPFIVRRNIIRRYFATSELADLLRQTDEQLFQDGDGNYAFT